MRQYFLIILLIFGVVSVSSAQMSKADMEFEQLNYYTAYDLYKKVYASNKSNVVLHKIVICCQKTNMYKEGELWGQKLTMSDPKNPDSFIAYGNILISNGNYKEAKQSFITAESLASDAKKISEAKKLIIACDSAYKWQIAPANRAEVKPVPALNTPYSDWGLVKHFGGYVFSSDRVTKTISADGKVSGSTGRPYLKMFEVAFDEDENTFGTPKLFSDFFNGQYHTAGPAFTENHNTVYFTRTRQISAAESGGEAPVVRLEIFYSEAFRDIKPFKYNSPLKYSVGDPAINSDDTRLYFVSDMPGGYGGTDIWYCDKLPNGDWGQIKNAGPEVNTAGDERFPMLMSDNTMYFSSNGRLGMGGLDVYRATRRDDKWGEIYHMDYPINSAQDDFGYTITKVRKQPGEPGMVILEGFLSSDRFGGMGADDIYRFKLIMPQFQLDYVYKGRLLSSETGAPIADVAISVTDKDTKETSQFKSGSDGRYEVPLKPNADFEVVMKKGNFFAQKFNISTDNTDGSTPKKMNIEFDAIVINKAIVLDNIYWNFNSATISDKSKEALDKLVEIMMYNPGIKIEVSSHTDSKGDDKANMTMSDKRAQAVLDYLVSKGISVSRLKAKGYGKTKPLIDCGDDCLPEEDAKNRRTEFKVTSTSEK